MEREATAFLRKPAVFDCSGSTVLVDVCESSALVLSRRAIPHRRFRRAPGREFPGSLDIPSGLQTVGYLPAATNDDFRKFLRALADADVRTSLTIPSDLRSTLPPVKLQPNERIIVSLYEGFLRGANLIEEKPSITLLKEIAADLNLPAIAAKAYQHGSDAIEVTLKQEGNQASLSARFEEGTLRFVGEAVSKFAKDNF